MNDNILYEVDWNEFWKGICENENGDVDILQVKKELSDYRFILNQVPKIYKHITGGLLSKPMYDAQTIITKADDYYQELYKNFYKEDINNILNDDSLGSEEKLKFISSYINE